MIKEGDKVKLKTGEIALISEVLENGVMYIAEIFTLEGVSIDHVPYVDIISVFEEVEKNLKDVI